MRTEHREERRQQIGDAVLQVAAEQGVAAVSLRSVAAQAGVSMGRVQYHFGTVTDLLRYAAQLAAGRIQERTEGGDEDTGPDRLKHLAEALLADDAQLVTTLRAYAQLRTLAARDEQIAATITGLTDPLREQIESVLADAAGKRILHSLVDPRLEADVFWTLVLGMAIEVAQGVRDRGHALDAIRYHFLTLARSRRVTRPVGRGRGSRV